MDGNLLGPEERRQENPEGDEWRSQRLRARERHDGSKDIHEQGNLLSRARDSKIGLPPEAGKPLKRWNSLRSPSEHLFSTLAKIRDNQELRSGRRSVPIMILN
jgi:hypothetical protein